MVSQVFAFMLGLLCIWSHFFAFICHLQRVSTPVTIWDTITKSNTRPDLDLDLDLDDCKRKCNNRPLILSF